MDNKDIQNAIQACDAGGVIAYPTEAVYGLGCIPENRPAVERILQLKNRSVSKGLILVSSKIDQLEGFVDFSCINNMQKIRDSWPGPYTWLIPAKAETPDWLTGEHKTLAVRVSAHPVVQLLCAELGPIVSTSANPQDSEPARSDIEVKQYFQDKIDYVLPGNIAAGANPTEIRDAMTDKVIRSG